MPLLRYDLGDTAVVGGPCACGNPLPTFERITGRVQDHFVAADGTRVHAGYLISLFYGRDWVDEFQVLLGGNKVYAPRDGEAYMPLEFSAATFRFGLLVSLPAENEGNRETDQEASQSGQSRVPRHRAR